MTKALNRNQLIRMREIFSPVFSFLNDTLISHEIYKLTVEGDKDTVHYIVSGWDVNGNMKDVRVDYYLPKDEFYYDKKVKFARGTVDNAEVVLKKIIDDLETVDFPINKIMVENGTRWVAGFLMEDRDEKTGALYEGYNLLLKSDCAFNFYGLSKDKDEEMREADRMVGLG